MSASITVITSNGLVLQNLRTLVDAQRIVDGLTPIPGYAKLRRLVGNVSTAADCIIYLTPDIDNPAFALAGNEPSDKWEKEDSLRLESVWMLSGTNTSNAILNIEVSY